MGGGGAVTYYEYCARAEIDLAQVKPIKIIKHINCQPKCLLSNFRPGANHIRVAPIKFVYCQQALTVPDGWGGGTGKGTHFECARIFMARLAETTTRRNRAKAKPDTNCVLGL